MHAIVLCSEQVPGEDPDITSRYAVNFVRGLQEGKEDPKHLKVMHSCYSGVESLVAKLYTRRFLS